MPSVLSTTGHVSERRKVRAFLIADSGGTEPQATAQTLPDDVLLEIFAYHRLASLRSGSWKWHRLAQVCRKWRFVVFAYPRLLDLRVVATYNTSIPDFWPTLPIIIWYPHSALHPFLSPRDEHNICDILKNPARICEMHIDVTGALLCCSSLLESFPALEHLRLTSHDTIVFPENFLNGSTTSPQLRVVHLDSCAFPTLPRLLSSSKNIVSLQLEQIPIAGFFTAEDLAVGLSTATQLESLKINFHPTVRPPRRDESSFPTRFLLPALIEFQYGGSDIYLEDFASRIDAPVLEQIGVTFVCSFEYDTHELCAFFGRGEELRSSRGRTTHIRFFEESVVFTHHFSRFPSSPGSFRLRLPYPSWLDEHVALMTQMCLGFQSCGALHKVTRLEIEGFPEPSRWQREMNPDHWLSILRTLTGVRRLHVVGTLVSSVVSALAQITEEITTREILPALRDLHLQGGPATFASMSAFVEPFIAARHRYGTPVSVHYKGLDWHDDCSSE